MNKRKKTVPVICFASMFFISMLFITGCSANQKKMISEEISAISQAALPGVFVANYDISDFNDSYFTERRGIPTFVERKVIPGKTKDLNAFLIKTDETGVVTHYFIGVDPSELMKSPKEAEKFYAFLSSLDESTQADILYPSYGYRVWDKISTTGFEQKKNEYKTVSEGILNTGKANVYFPGKEIWLIGNPGCFADENGLVIGSDASKMIIMSSFCDGLYAISSSADVEEYFKELSENMDILDANLPVIKKEQGESEILFLGDSIFGIYGPPSSIPEVVRSLSGAEVANCGIGGLSLHADVNSPGLDGLLDIILQENSAENTDITNHVISENAGSFAYGSTLFQKNPEEPFTVLIEFGINDYVSGVKAEEFEKDLNDAVDRLESEERHARIVLVVPGFLNMPDMENGQIPFQKDGEPMEVYREIIRKVALQRNLRCFDMTKSDFITQENCYYYLEADGIHYGSRGRFLTAMELCEFLEGDR